MGCTFTQYIFIAHLTSATLSSPLNSEASNENLGMQLGFPSVFTQYCHSFVVATNIEGIRINTNYCSMVMPIRSNPREEGQEREASA